MRKVPRAKGFLDAVQRSSIGVRLPHRREKNSEVELKPKRLPRQNTAGKVSE